MTQMIRDFEDIEAVNQQIEKMYHFVSLLKISLRSFSSYTKGVITSGFG